MTEENKQLVQAVIDRILYSKNYKSRLIEFNQQFDPSVQCNYTTDVKKFLFN